MENNYYFVIFGREPGGLFDLLGLAPTASSDDVAEASVKYKTHLIADMKTKRGKLREEKLDKNLITKEEFNAEADKLNAELNDKETLFNELTEDYELGKSEKRKLVKMGLYFEQPVWFPLFEEIDPSNSKDFFQKISSPGTLPRISSKDIEKITDKLLKDESWVEEKYSSFATEKTLNSKKLDLIKYLEIIMNVNLQRLLWVDLLWQKLQSTHRNYWIEKINAWIKAYSVSEKIWLKEADRKVLKNTDFLENFSEPSAKAIDLLDIGEEVEEIYLPERRRSQPTGIDLKDLLEQLARSEKTGTDKPDEKELMEQFFKALLQGKAPKQKKT